MELVIVMESYIKDILTANERHFKKGNLLNYDCSYDKVTRANLRGHTTFCNFFVTQLLI